MGCKITIILEMRMRDHDRIKFRLMMGCRIRIILDFLETRHEIAMVYLEICAKLNKEWIFGTKSDLRVRSEKIETKRIEH